MDIESNIRGILTALKNGEATLESVVQVLWINLCSMAQIERTPEIRELIMDIVNKYQDGVLDDTITVELFQKISTGNVEEVYTLLATYTDEPTDLGDESYESYGGGGGGGSSSSGGKSKTIIDVDFDKAQAVSSACGEIENDIAAIEFVSPSEVGSYTAEISSAVQDGKTKLSTKIEEMRKSLVEVMNTVAGVDDSMPDLDLTNMSFTNIGSVFQKLGQSSEVKMLNEETFKKLGYEADANGFIEINGSRYNVKNHMFYNGNDKAFEAYFYVPQYALTNKDLALNTYTFFSDSGHKNLIDSCQSNSMLLRITKFPSDKRFDKFNEVALATKFINEVKTTAATNYINNSGKTEEEKATAIATLKSCHNIIAGDSAYGANALKVAAASGDLYQTVYCINNAAIVAGENGVAGTKTQFATLEELKGLDGKDIWFINAPGDENLNRGEGKPWSTKLPYDRSYVYTGIKLITENCPNAKVHFVTNEAQVKDKEYVMVDLYKNYSAPNYSYDSAQWPNITSTSIREHSGGHNVVYDAAKWAVTNAVVTA